MAMTPAHDYDWVVVGSGFGGSVAALRLAEKGYRVCVLEQGRRFADSDFAGDASELGKVWWWPGLGLRGIMRMTVFKHVTVLSGDVDGNDATDAHGVVTDTGNVNGSNGEGGNIEKLDEFAKKVNTIMEFSKRGGMVTFQEISVLRYEKGEKYK